MKEKLKSAFSKKDKDNTELELVLQKIKEKVKSAFSKKDKDVGLDQLSE